MLSRPNSRRPAGSINKWLGDELAVYMDQMTLGDNLLGQVSTQAIASVMEELDKEASALTEKIQGLIRENNGSPVISKDQISTRNFRIIWRRWRPMSVCSVVVSSRSFTCRIMWTV